MPRLVNKETMERKEKNKWVFENITPEGGVLFNGMSALEVTKMSDKDFDSIFPECPIDEFTTQGVVIEKDGKYVAENYFTKKLMWTTNIDRAEIYNSDLKSPTEIMHKKYFMFKDMSDSKLIPIKKKSVYTIDK